MTSDTRADLLRRVRVAHDNARVKAADSRQASLDRGALIEALVVDGASYSEIGGTLGVSKMSVMRLLRRYQAARGDEARPPDPPRPGSRRGQTRLGGHGLVGEGTPAWRVGGCARCQCGALSEPGISQQAARRWILEHKVAVIAARDAE